MANFTFPMINSTFNSFEGLMVYPNVVTNGAFGVALLLFSFLVITIGMTKRSQLKQSVTVGSVMTWIIAVFLRMTVTNGYQLITDDILLSTTVLMIAWLLFDYLTER